MLFAFVVKAKEEFNLLYRVKNFRYREITVSAELAFLEVTGHQDIEICQTFYLRQYLAAIGNYPQCSQPCQTLNKDYFQCQRGQEPTRQCDSLIFRGWGLRA